jgi:hypothetical protein
MKIDIMKMKLHDRVCINKEEGIYCMKVVGGWIYEYQKPIVNILKLVFVPHQEIKLN